MFRKLVSNLAFSPALIHEVGFYAHRLRHEDTTRRLTVIFVILALIMQSLAVFSPPESANASSEQDIIRGGVSSLDDFLARYDNNEDDVKDILTTVGLTRDEIAGMSRSSIKSTTDTYVMSRYGQIGSSGNEASMSYQRSTGGADVRYFSLLTDLAGSTTSFDGWTGHSQTLGWFGIIKASASLVTKGLPSTLDPRTGLASTSLKKEVSVRNLTQGTSSDVSAAKPLDKLTYSIRITNNGKTTTAAEFSVRIADVLEYASLIDGGGGSFNPSTNTLSWPQTVLGQGQSQERTFAVQLNESFPATSTGKSNPESYDCKLTLNFGNTSTTPVDCPPAKVVESLFSQMPTTGIGVNVAFGLIILAVVVFFAVRTRQLKREIRLVRHNLNTGIL